ncbi:hypothetical protein [Litoreibacter roseus]|nr:hypothetical protein [Litoreibacter roseus]
MECQISLAEKCRHNNTSEINVELMEQALLLLSRLLGRQAALDFVRDPGMLIGGDTE